MTEPIVIARAEVGRHLADVLVAEGSIVAVTPAGTARSGRVIDAGGGALIPGLHDHHVHLLASARALDSTPCGPPAVRDADAFRDALRTADATLVAGRWIRGVGYHESIAGDIDRVALDAIVPTRPCRVQHRSGHAWILNSAALAAAGIADGGSFPTGIELDASAAPTGRIFGLDGWLGQRIPRLQPDLRRLGRRLVGYGVTGVTDATPADPATLIEAMQRAGFPLRVAVTGPPDRPPEAVNGAMVGPAKIVLGDYQLPGLDDLVDRFRTARANRRRVAVHTVTRASLALALAAWDEVGPKAGDRIEHAAVVPDDALSRIARLGVTVVTQPGFIADRGDDYLADVDIDDRAHLWRCASLVAAGVPVGLSTDAPLGNPDPWRAISSAVQRGTEAGALLGPSERVAPAAALDRFVTALDDPGGAPRRVVVGQPADLCLLDVPLVDALAAPTSDHVRVTFIGGVPYDPR